ncbi:hypothetical protein ACFW9I_36280 [[Kitasatospora] papulosa]|uniref:hypothetical protein n=1 Tax=[Kitasatospora] papulosa TaxID=1464011 RepID=UPI0036A2B5BC
MAVYEPAGRVEMPKIPTEAEEPLQAAFDRARPALSRVIPSITTCRPWTYVEYGPDQYITSHLDAPRALPPALMHQPCQQSWTSVPSRP